MSGVLRPITTAELVDMPAAFLEFAERSDPLLAGSFGDRLVCIVGFIPFPDHTYLWMYTTPDMLCHRLAYGRHAKRLIATMLKRYPRIVGHSNIASLRWLQFLGAEVVHTTDGIVEFTIYG